MGWFDDNHWAGEAYNFGMGYMCGGGLDSDDNFSDDGLGFSQRCKGITQAGRRCKITEDSPYPTARTISLHGYCSQHLNQCDFASEASTNKRKWEEPQHPLIMAANSGRTEDVKTILDSTQNDIKALNIPPEVGTALVASVREAHLEVVAELLCIGADLKVLPEVPKQTVESALKDVQGLLSSKLKQSRSVVRSLLERRGRLECVKALLVSASPLPPLPTMPLEPPMREIESLKVDELKDLLRKHGAKVSGRKAELIERARAGKYMELEHDEELQKHEQLRQEANLRRVELEAQVSQRAASVRSIVRDSSPRIPTEAEIDALARPIDQAIDARHKSNGYLGRRDGTPPKCFAPICPGSKPASIEYSGMPFQMLLSSQNVLDTPSPSRAMINPNMSLPGLSNEAGPPCKKLDTRHVRSNDSIYARNIYANLDGGKCIHCCENTAAKACSFKMCGKCCRNLNCARHRSAA